MSVYACGTVCLCMHVCTVCLCMHAVQYVCVGCTLLLEERLLYLLLQVPQNTTGSSAEWNSMEEAEVEKEEEVCLKLRVTGMQYIHNITL